MGNSLVTWNSTWLNLCTYLTPNNAPSNPSATWDPNLNQTMWTANSQQWSVFSLFLLTIKPWFCAVTLGLCRGMKVDRPFSLDWFWIHFVMMQNRIVPKWTAQKNPLFTILCICITGCAYDCNQIDALWKGTLQEKWLCNIIGQLQQRRALVSSSALRTTLPLLLNPIQDSPGQIVKPLNDSLNWTPVDLTSVGLTCAINALWIKLPC